MPIKLRSRSTYTASVVLPRGLRAKAAAAHSSLPHDAGGREIKLIYLQSCATPSFGETLDRVIRMRSHLYLDFANASHAELKKLSAPCGSRELGVHMCHALAQHLPIETALHPES